MVEIWTQGEIQPASQGQEEVHTRPRFSMDDVTKSDVHVCMWKPPADAFEAAQGTAQMLMKIFEKRHMWTRTPLPPNYMHAFERTTYSLDCVYVSKRRHRLDDLLIPSWTEQ